MTQIKTGVPEYHSRSGEEIKKHLESLINREAEIQQELEKERQAQKYITNKSLALSKELQELPGYRKGLLYALGREDLI